MIGLFNDFCMTFVLISFIKYIDGAHLNCLDKSIEEYFVGIYFHLNCLDLSKQFKWVPTRYAFIRKQEKYMAVI